MKKEVKKLFMDLYREFPNGRLSEEIVHKIFITEEDRNFLVKHGFLLREETISNGKIKKYYNLGPNALQLISSWKIEKLTICTVVLTVTILIATIVNIFT
jgi:hypothetical protein